MRWLTGQNLRRIILDITKGHRLFNYLAEKHRYEEYPEKSDSIIADLIMMEDEEFDTI